MTAPRPPLDGAAREEMRQACEAMVDRPYRLGQGDALKKARLDFAATVTPERVLALLDELVTPAEAAAIQRVAEVDKLTRAATKAAAELRHAYRAHGQGRDPIDPNLVARAIEILERATVAK